MPRAQPTSRHWTILARPESVSAARRDVRKLALDWGADTQAQHAIALCVTEAVTNAVLHAYEGCASAGTIELEARLGAGELHVAVRDFGLGMRPNPKSPGLGLGMSLMAELADRVELRSAATGGTEVVFEFLLAASSGGDA